MKKKDVVIFQLSARNIIKNKRKYIVALLAVLLTSMMFATIISLGYMLLYSIQETQLRNSGDRSMVTIRFILPEDYEELKGDRTIKDVSYSQIVSYVETNDTITEIRYGEDEFARNMYSYPTKGRMPGEKLELATSTKVLKALGIDCEIGVTVPLAFELNGSMYENEFILSGFWEAEDEIAGTHQQCWISKQLSEEIVDNPNIPVFEREDASYTGYYMMDIDFYNSWNIGEKILNVLQNHDVDPEKVSCRINEAYMMAQGSSVMVAGFLAVLLFLIFVGYLLIYNIFHIRISLDTQYYALLKAVGMDQRQLRLAVRTESFFLTLIGAPVGILLGTGTAYLLIPLAARFLSFPVFLDRHVSWWVYLVIFCFVGVTVYISCRKPAKIVENVSLISGMEYQGLIRKRGEENGCVNLCKMAQWNILREKGKLWTVVVAVSFAVILFNTVFSVVSGFSLEKYLMDMIDKDYIITDTSILNMELERITDGISEDFRSSLEQMPGIRDIRYSYMAEGSLVLDASGQKNLAQMDIYQGNTFLQEQIKEGKISCQLYALNDDDVADIDFIQGTWDEEKFATGNYVIINTALSGGDMFYQVGEMVTVEYPEAGEKSYEVMAIGEVPYVLSSRYWTVPGCRVILSEKEYLEGMKTDNGAMLCRFDTDLEIFSSTELIKMVGEQQGLTCVSRDSYIEQFSNLKKAYLLIGGVIAGVLGLIGILNFANTIVTSINYRERELTILGVIGMTRKQTIKMLLWEGFFYAALSILFTDTVGLAISFGLVKLFESTSKYVDWSFQILPLLGGNLIFLLVACMATILTYWLIGRKEIGQRLQKFN